MFKRFPLWLLTAAGFVGYCLFPIWFPLLEFYGQIPPADIRSLQPSLWSALLYALLLICLFLIYARAINLLRRPESSWPLAKVIVAALFFSLPLLLTYPINANDIFRYVIRGRLASVYGANPYQTAPSSIGDDPLLPLGGEWIDVTSPYGPLWELGARSLTTLTSGDLLASLLSFKLLGVVTHLVIALIIGAIVLAGSDRSPPEKRRATAYAATWAWNPSLLLIFVADAHNDALMIFWLVLGYLFISRGRNILGLIVVALAALTKPVALLAWPVFAVGIMRRQASWPERIRLCFLAGVGSLAAFVLSFVPFGSPWDLASRLILEGSAGAGFSVSAFFILAARFADVTLSLSLLAWLTLTSFAILSLIIIWTVWRGRSSLKATADLFYTFLILAMNFRIWYAAWPFPWLLLDRAQLGSQGRAGYRLRAGIWFLLTSQLSVLIYSHFRVGLLNGDIVLAHLIGVPFTFLLPFVLAQLNVFRFDRNVLP